LRVADPCLHAGLDGQHALAHAQNAAARATTAMTVGIARVTLFLPGSHSLKEKRMVLRRVKTHVREKFNAAIAEVGDNDLWQRAALGITLVGNERAFTEAALDEVIRFVRTQADVINVEHELQTFSDAFGVGADVQHWKGST
jgi:uncharacterized protein YlxP (DUF503 family)